MSSKKKGKRQKAAKAKPPSFINGLTIDEMSPEQIEEHIARLQEEVDREREERNYFQLEKDEIDSFREVSDRNLEVINSEKFKEDEEELFHEEIRIYRLKIKHLLCEHENAISELKADGLNIIKALQKEQDQLKGDLLKKKRELLIDMEEIDSDNPIRELEVKHVEEMGTARNNWEKQLREILAKNEENMHLLQSDLENFRKNGILEKEFQGTGHIFAVKEDHRKVKNCAYGILNKFEMEAKKVHQIEDVCGDMNFKMKEDEEITSVLQDTVSAESITKTMEEDANTVKKTTSYPNRKDPVLHYKKTLEDLKLKHEIMEQKFSQLQQERDKLFSSFSQKIQRAQDKVDMGNKLLKRQLEALTESLEKTQAQLYSLISAPNMDHTGLRMLTNQILVNLQFRKLAMKNLESKRNMIAEVAAEAPDC